MKGYRRADLSPIPDGDYGEIERELGDRERVVAKSTVEDAKVSTVFLVLDHSHDDDGPPVLWETMIFGGEHDEYQWRYASLESARRGHEDVVKHLLQCPGQGCDWTD